jgi:hypothetical protein
MLTTLPAHLRAMNYALEGLGKGRTGHCPQQRVDTMNYRRVGRMVSLAQQNLPKEEKTGFYQAAG